MRLDDCCFFYCGASILMEEFWKLADCSPIYCFVVLSVSNC